MTEPKNDRYYLQRIMTDLIFLHNHTQGLTEPELTADEVLLDSVMFRMIQIAENADRLTEAFKTKQAAIPWRAIKGMRNRLVHEYGHVDLSVIYRTVSEDIPDLLELLAKIKP